MQQFEERNTYTPTNIPHVCSNCDLSLNVEETLCVAGLKTSLNILQSEHAGQNLRVSVNVIRLYPNQEYDSRFVIRQPIISWSGVRFLPVL